MTDEPTTPLPYEPPVLTPLGTLTDLTQGGNLTAGSDGFGFAGDEGNIGSV